MATTTNFGWETPDDTDLVKDGAAAMRTLGNSIDTSFVDLKGGTTNQVLAKNSNTDLDFKWVADATGIPATIIDAKGDLIAGTAADTAGRLAVGANGTVLTADSGETTGLKWATVAATKNFSLLNAGGTSLTGSTTVTVSSLSGYDQFYVLVTGASTTGSPYPTISLRLNTDTGNNYYSFGWTISAGATYGSGNITGNEQNPASSYRLAQMSDNAASVVHGGFFINGANTAGLKMIMGTGGGTAGGGEGQLVNSRIGYYNSSSVISSISLFSSSGNFDAGTVFIYGSV